MQKGFALHSWISRESRRQKTTKRYSRQWEEEDCTPFLLTPRCLSSAASMSLEPLSMQGVVPQTCRWYLPTCTATIRRRGQH